MTPPKRIGILGATGQAGRHIAKKMAEAGFADIVLIGRNADKLEALRRSFAPASQRLPEIAVAKASDVKSLESAFTGLDLVVVAVSSAEYLSTIAQAALNTKTDCLDILLCSEPKRRFLETQRDLFQKFGVTYIADGGYHPGVPAALILYAETFCPNLQTANVYGSFGVNWRKHPVSFDTMLDFVREMAHMDVSILKEGRWVSDWRNMTKFDFQDGRGAQNCVPMGMDEIQQLPQFMPGIKNAGFFIAGFGRMVDWVIMPLAMIALKIYPKAIERVARFFVWGLKTFGGDKEWARLRLVGEGDHGKIEIVLSYPSAYELTALPVVACLKQYVEGPKRPGLHRQALFVEPKQFFEDLKQMGVSVIVQRPNPVS